MTSLEAYNLVCDIMDKPRNGNVDPNVFVRFLNSAQLSYMSFLLGSLGDYRPGSPLSRASSEVSGRAMDALSPFWTPQRWEPATNNRIRVALRYPDGSTDYAGEPKIYMYGMEEGCAPGDTIDWTRPFERIQPSMWERRSNPRAYDTPTLDNPGFIIYGDFAELRPLNLAGAWVRYIRNPQPITLATLPNGDPDPSATNSNPEWRDIDMSPFGNGILSGVLWLCGIREQMPSWMQGSTRPS